MAAATKPTVEVQSLKNFALVDPKDIVVDPKANSRRVKAENVKAMARSFEQRGQDTPVRCVLLPDGSLKLVFGYTRHAGAVEFNKNHPDKPMKLKVEIVKDLDEKSAYIASVVENFQRTDPDPIEIAQQCKELLEGFGLDLRAVADIFGKPGSDGVDWVTWIQKLLQLPKAARDLVKQKQLPVVAAQELVGLDEKEVMNILESAERFGPEQRIKGESVRKAARESRRKGAGSGEGDGEGEGNAKTSRSAKEVKAFLEGLSGPAEDKGVKNLVNKILDFWEGKINLETAERWVRTLGGTIPENKEAKAAAKAAVEEPAAEEPPMEGEEPKGAAKGKGKGKGAGKAKGKSGGKGKGKTAPAEQEPPMEGEESATATKAEPEPALA